MVVLIDGVVKEVDPVISAVPPLAAAYQSIVSPAPGVAEMVTVPVPQRELGTAVGAAGNAFIVAMTADLAETQPVVVLRASA